MKPSSYLMLSAILVGTICLFTSPLKANVVEVAKYQRKLGWFVESDVGIFVPLFGFRDPFISDASDTQIQRHLAVLSSVQPNVGVVVGYDVLSFMSLGVKLSQGYVANAARSKSDIKAPTDFGLSFAEFFLRFSSQFHPQVSGSITATAGALLITPSEMNFSNRIGFSTSIGLGFRYDTLRYGFYFGLNSYARFSFIRNTSINGFPGIISFSVIPKVGYVF